jgi:hypothetical protein
MEKEKEILNIKYRENISPSVDVYHLVSLKNIHIFFEFKKNLLYTGLFIINVPLQLALKTHTNFGCAAQTDFHYLSTILVSLML